jgi:hypothetical protein
MIYDISYKMVICYSLSLVASLKQKLCYAMKYLWISNRF